MTSYVATNYTVLCTAHAHVIYMKRLFVFAVVDEDDKFD